MKDDQQNVPLPVATVEALTSAVVTLQSGFTIMQNTLASNTEANKELNQSVKDLRQEMSQTYVRKDVLEPTLETMKAQIKQHNEWFTWAVRIVISLVIVAIVGGVLVSGK